MMSKFEQFMEEICKSFDEVCQSQESWHENSSTITSAQEKASQELVQRISKSSYQLQQKGHERQFNCNSSMQQSIATAKNELVKMIPAGEKEKEALKMLQILWIKVPKPWQQGKNISNLQTVQNMAGVQFNVMRPTC